jgi:phosphatidylglycerophosphate synthase
MHRQAYYIINGVTLYRLISAPILLLVIILGRQDIFRILLAFSLFTDAIDGFLARRLKVTSRFGARVDSIADDLTMAAALVAIIVFRPSFLKHELAFIIPVSILYISQMLAAILRYRRPTSFHTYSAKAATILQGIFLLLFFFLDGNFYFLFRLVTIATGLSLLEELIIVLLLSVPRSDVKGLFWIWKEKRNSGTSR